MKRIESGIIAIMKNGTLIWFEEDKEYRDWIKTGEVKKASFLFSSPKQILPHLVNEANLENSFERIEKQIEIQRRDRSMRGEDG